MLNGKLNYVSYSILAFLFGVFVWMVVKYLLVVNDPQSDIRYWLYGYSLLLVISFSMSIIHGKPWLWTVSLISSQLFAGIVLRNGDLNQLPIGIVVHVLIMLPCLLLSLLGNFIGKRWRKTKG
jgi:phosphoglycerol transferase MdoB-like AlkP superfamily enzyme